MFSEKYKVTKYREGVIRIIGDGREFHTPFKRSAEEILLR